MSDSSVPADGSSIMRPEVTSMETAAWIRLLEAAHRRRDQLSVTSLEIIVEGVREIDRLTDEAAKRGEAPQQLSTFSQAMFTRLAKSYNNPMLLKEVGVVYLRDLRLPEVALHHFERALRLGGAEKDLRPLIEAAAVTRQRDIAQRSGELPAHSGIVTSQHAKPVATHVIRKTGQLISGARFTQSSTTRLPEQAGETEIELSQPLPATTEECLAAAEEAIPRKKFRRAEALLRRSNVEPVSRSTMWQAWTNLGQAAYEAGESTIVEEAFAEALAFGSKDMVSHFNLGLGYHLNEKHDLALVSYLMANQIQPDHPKVWCNMGALYFQMEQLDQAEAALRHAIEVYPDYARAWDNLAATLGAQGQLDEAMKACERAITLRPHYPEAFFKRGVILFHKDNLPAAAEAFLEAMPLAPLTVYCHAFLAMIYARLEDTDKAEEAVRQVVQADPRCEMLWMAWNDLGQAWETRGDHQKAAMAYGEATMIQPDQPEAWFNLGVSYHRSGDLAAARDSYQHAVDLKDGLAVGWHNLGIVCAELGDHLRAMTAFRQEVRWLPNNVRAWYDLGVALEKLGRPEEAAVAYAKVEALSRRSEASEDVQMPTSPLPAMPRGGMVG